MATAKKRQQLKLLKKRQQLSPQLKLLKKRQQKQ